MDEEMRKKDLEMYQAQLAYEAGKRYFLKLGKDSPWKHVTKAEWVSAERGAGFWPKGRERGEPTTGGFSSQGVEGMIYNLTFGDVDYYDSWIPEYAKTVRAMIQEEQGDERIR